MADFRVQLDGKADLVFNGEVGCSEATICPHEATLVAFFDERRLTKRLCEAGGIDAARRVA